MDINATDTDGDSVNIASCEILQIEGSVVQKTYSLDCQNGKIVLDPLAIDPNIDPAKGYKLSVVVEDDK
ncbi:hypothetical protein [Persephonella sp.]